MQSSFFGKKKFSCPVAAEIAISFEIVLEVAKSFSFSLMVVLQEHSSKQDLISHWVGVFLWTSFMEILCCLTTGHLL